MSGNAQSLAVCSAGAPAVNSTGYNGNTKIWFSQTDLAATGSDQYQPGALDIWQDEVYTLADQAVADNLSSPIDQTPISAVYGKYISDPSRDFRNAQVAPMVVSQMTPAQRNAYDSWLSDPTVQSIIYSPKNLGGTILK